MRQSKELDKPREGEQLLCDVHTHTLFSRHAYSTIEENVRAAAEAGLELLGSTDHFSAMLEPKTPFDGTDDLENYQFYINQRVWPRLWHGVILLRGVEADIVDLDGHLFGYGHAIPSSITGKRFAETTDLDERVLSKLDYTIASIHGSNFTQDATSLQLTNMYIKALENPHVLILGHIVRSKLDVEFDPILEAARDMNKLIEINEYTLGGYSEHVEKVKRLAERAAELNCQIAVSSDAHIAPYIGKYPMVENLFEEIGFPRELIATRDAQSFLLALDRANIARPQLDSPFKKLPDAQKDLLPE
ncbi:MAG: hypothetical protein IKE43_01050 [Coriobacteriales bacterium]|nr:hypothetical protein [Coriobacteriales bacterium]